VLPERYEKYSTDMARKKNPLVADAQNEIAVVGSTPEPEDNSLSFRVDSDYTSENIQVLEGLEAVRQRPAMYIGDTGSRGLHHLFNEVLDNSIDEALAGHCDTITSTLHADNTISVQDNGRGIPVDVMPKYGVSALQIVMCTLHAGGKFGGGGYHVSGGLHGVGVSCVNALAESCTVIVERAGKKYTQSYTRGIPLSDVEEIGKTDRRGTSTRWLADSEIFGEIKYDPAIFKNRIRELAYLNPAVTLVFVDEQNPDASETFHYSTGIQALVEDLNRPHDTIHKCIHFRRLKDDVEVDVALQYHTGYKETILSFANNINTIEGGTHTTGAKTALTRAINSYARKAGTLKEKDPNFLGEDVRGGLTMVLSVKLKHPQFEGQTKTKLGNSEVDGIVNSIVGEGLAEFLEENPSIAKKIVDKSVAERNVREAMKKAAEAVRRGNAVDSYGLAAKLADCIEKDPSKAELFIVEGDSAAGPAKGGRDRKFQAVLPIRGKILNVERARVDKALDNEEIKKLISSLGTGIDITVGRSHDDDEAGMNGNGKDTGFDLTKLRYHKVIIMTDADVDGEHIRTLLLTFFYRYMRPLLEKSHVYFSKPPLFTIKAGKDERYYAQDETERDEILKGLKKKDIVITRFKGLGEMNAEELEETAMNPNTRRLVRVELDPDWIAQTEEMFSTLMGEKVEPRREYIERHAKEVTDLDWHY
jgi:DNA gyrase subunit B